MNDALAAKTALKTALRAAGIAASCGITQNSSGLAIKVNLPDGNRAAEIPAQHLGIPVVVEIIGRVTVQPVDF